MSRSFYEALYRRTLQSPLLGQTVKACDRLLTGLGYIAYPLLLICLYLRKDGRLLKFVLVPGLLFVLLSVFRKVLNAPRPGEVFGLETLLCHSSGRSFPSRHVYSAAMIAFCWMQLLPWAGTVLLVCAVLLAVCRVAGGLHFIRDTLAGFVLAAAGALLLQF